VEAAEVVFSRFDLLASASAGLDEELAPFSLGDGVKLALNDRAAIAFGVRKTASVLASA